MHTYNAWESVVCHTGPICPLGCGDEDVSSLQRNQWGGLHTREQRGSQLHPASRLSSTRPGVHMRLSRMQTRRAALPNLAFLGSRYHCTGTTLITHHRPLLSISQGKGDVPPCYTGGWPAVLALVRGAARGLQLQERPGSPEQPLELQLLRESQDDSCLYPGKCASMLWEGGRRYFSEGWSVWGEW